ncbi:MAG TPA: FlgD immunoglobulin-like domain containing protein [Candidatus Kapabacteria bacterium]|nr:FlgD immunoglobulin-like domain containing protein [Candidatus Kapabacteria bacterium]
MRAVLLLLFLTPAVARAQTGGSDTTTKRPPSQFDQSAHADSVKAALERLQWYYRLRERIHGDSLALHRYLDSLDNTRMAIMRRNLTFSSKDWLPTAADRARRDDEIKRSQGWDKVFTNSTRVGFSTPIQGILRAVGLIEDVTPRIAYTLMHTTRVEVTVYDLQAHTVAVLVNDVQSPGEYKFDWNLLDSSGARVETGDYIAEVIANDPDGRKLLLRKRIEVP